MGYLIGTDEAGYGPNLGPLVVSATVWRVEDSPRGVDLYERLYPAVTKDPCDASDPREPSRNDAEAKPRPATRLWIADSKVVYRPAQGLAALELGVQAALGCCGTLPGDWPALWLALTGSTPPSAEADPCCA